MKLGHYPCIPQARARAGKSLSLRLSRACGSARYFKGQSPSELGQSRSNQAGPYKPLILISSCGSLGSNCWNIHRSVLETGACDLSDLAFRPHCRLLSSVTTPCSVYQRRDPKPWAVNLVWSISGLWRSSIGRPALEICCGNAPRPRRLMRRRRDSLPGFSSSFLI